MATLTIPQALDLSRQCLEAGRLADAEGILQQVLAKEPRNAEALHLLGVVAHQVGRNDVAADLVRQAVVLDPISAHYRNTQGVVRHALGQLDEAVGELRCALQLDPRLVQAQNNLGNALRAQGRIAEAVESYRAALRQRPDYSEARNNLGNALKELGDPQAAAVEYRAVLEAGPDNPAVRNNLGAALNDLGQFTEAAAEFRAVLALNPMIALTHCNLGNALRGLGQLDAAVAEYRTAIAQQPELADAHLRLGVALREMGEAGAAIAECREAVRLQPEFAEAHNSLGNALQDSGQVEAAISSLETAVRLRPDYASAHNNLGSALKERGDIEAAAEHFRSGVALDPGDAAMQSNLVYTQQFLPAADAGTLRAAQAEWSARHASLLAAEVREHPNARDPERRLKIGYVSPDFWGQAECYFVVPLLEAHDRERFEIVCYADVRRRDAVTERYQKCADQWCETLGMSDAELAERIRADGIDILVDLTMHMRHHRLLAFARKPAPVQVSWLAYPGSTGLPTMDYRITDAAMERAGTDDFAASEQPKRLDGCWVCYEPVGGAPEVGELPALTAGHVTFGSLNHPCKHNDAVLRRWAGVLAAVPDSRLLLLCPEGAGRDRVTAILQMCGVAAERVEFTAMQPREDYLRLYGRIDLALDPFPYNGITTTCDALWMGVPVLTVAGTLPQSRAGLSLLTAAGVTEFAAESEDDLVKIAAELAHDLPRLAQLRASLRERMRASSLMDARRFAGEMERAYREMWRAWCG